MAYSDSSIVIHLLKDAKNIQLDDTVRIVKNLEDSTFEITFKDNGDPLIHKAHEMTRDHICDYVYHLLKNLTLDEDGYQQIQFSLPAMPRLLVNAYILRDANQRDYFLELIENSLSMLDKVEKLSIKKPTSKNYPLRNTCYADIHSSSGCCELKTKSHGSSLPNLPESPVHRYFE